MAAKNSTILHNASLLALPLHFQERLAERDCMASISY